jgi:hypothetical protein
MPKRSLKTLLKVRNSTVKQAQVALADALAVEQAAAAEEARLTSAIRRELEAAAASDTDDAAVEAVGRWLPAAQERQHTAEIRRQAAESGTARARAALSAARTAEKIVKAMIAADQDEERAKRERKGQAELLERLSIRPETS